MGNLGGSGVQAIFSHPNLETFVVDSVNQKIYFPNAIVGVYEYDIASAETTPIFETASAAEFISPQVFFDVETSTLYWTTNVGLLSTPSEVEGVPTNIDLPIRTLNYTNRIHFTELAFDSGNPIPISIVDWRPKHILITGGLDGNDPSKSPLPLDEMFPPVSSRSISTVDSSTTRQGGSLAHRSTALGRYPSVTTMAQSPSTRPSSATPRIRRSPLFPRLAARPIDRQSRSSAAPPMTHPSQACAGLMMASTRARSNFLAVTSPSHKSRYPRAKIF